MIFMREDDAVETRVRRPASAAESEKRMLQSLAELSTTCQRVMTSNEKEISHGRGRWHSDWKF